MNSLSEVDSWGVASGYKPSGHVFDSRAHCEIKKRFSALKSAVPPKWLLRVKSCCLLNGQLKCSADFDFLVRRMAHLTQSLLHLTPKLHRWTKISSHRSH